jgi:hypothetical protein
MFGVFLTFLFQPVDPLPLERHISLLTTSFKELWARLEMGKNVSSDPIA